MQTTLRLICMNESSCLPERVSLVLWSAKLNSSLSAVCPTQGWLTLRLLAVVFIFLPKIALCMSSVLLMAFSRNEHLCGSTGGERHNYTSLRPTAPPLSWIKHPHKLTLDNIQNQWQTGQSPPTEMCKYDSLPCRCPQITLPFPALRQHVAAGTVIDWSY